MITIHASALAQSARCHGYRTLSTPGTPATEAGTRFHAYAQARLGGDELPEPTDAAEGREWDAWWTWWQAQEWGPPTVVERRYRLDIGEATLSGRVDAAWVQNGEAVVVDWKWSENPDGFAPVEYDPQMAAYGLLVAAATQATRVAVVRVMARQQDMGEPLILLDADSITETCDRIAHLVAAVTADEEFSPGPHCERCLAKAVCDRYLAQAHHLVPMRHLDLSLPLTDEQAASAASALGAAETLLKLARQRLQLHVEGGGVIRVDGKTWGPAEHTRAHLVDGPAALQILAEQAGDEAAAAAQTTTLALVRQALGQMDEETAAETRRLLAGVGAVEERQVVSWRWRRK